MQLRRFEDAYWELVQANSNADERRSLADAPTHQWRVFYDTLEPFDPQRPLRVPTMALEMQVTSELHFLTESVRNVLRAQERVPEADRPEMADQNVLKLLRDVTEHYDVETWAADDLARRHPHFWLGAVTHWSKDIWIGGLEGVPLSRIEAWLYRVRVALTGCLTAAGVEVPDDYQASTVEGDDALEWPKERLHFGWWLPTRDEADWPHEEMPPEVVDLLGQLFANWRARDPKD